MKRDRYKAAKTTTPTECRLASGAVGAPLGPPPPAGGAQAGAAPQLGRPTPMSPAPPKRGAAAAGLDQVDPAPPTRRRLSTDAVQA